MDDRKSCMRHRHPHQSECLIYALIQSEIEPHTTICIVHDNSLFKNMWTVDEPPAGDVIGDKLSLSELPGQGPLSCQKL